mgnify:CR=1 FL=1|jgi:hypothetical protein
MNIQGGRIFNISLSQEQFGEQYNSTGTLYYFKNRKYVFDTPNQRISYNNDMITTINKSTKQIIFDKNVENDITVLDILSGTNDQLEIEDSILEKHGFRISFNMRDWGIKGDIWTIPNTGEPKKIVLKIPGEGNIILNIISSEITTQINIPEIETSRYEIIDLRE